ncbi:MAG: hypothetical protein NUW37_03465 [Planctomycetes bacterium]|nr:hypothetical protein [Planctomycetota bacterium]
MYTYPFTSSKKNITIAALQILFSLSLLVFVGCISGSDGKSEHSASTPNSARDSEGKINDVDSNSTVMASMIRRDTDSVSYLSEEVEKSLSFILFEIDNISPEDIQRADELGIGLPPDLSCPLIEGFDLDQPAITDIRMSNSGVEELYRFNSSPYFKKSGKVLFPMVSTVRYFDNRRIEIHTTVYSGIDACKRAWLALATHYRLPSALVAIPLSEVGVTLLGESIFYTNFEDSKNYLGAYYAYHNVFIEVRIHQTDPQYLVDTIVSIDDYFFRQPLVETLDDSEFAPVINRFELENNRIHIGERSHIRLEVTNPDSELSVPDHSLLEAGIGVNWSGDKPSWLRITEGIDGHPWYSLKEDSDYGNVFVYPFEEEFVQTARVVDGVREVETVSAEPGTYPLRITVFNERGLTASAEIEVVVLPERERPDDSDDESDEDHNRGHGNDDDRHDEDNPGQGHGNQGDDHDRGHGNDDDRHDEDNPGRENRDP